MKIFKIRRPQDIASLLVFIDQLSKSGMLFEISHSEKISFRDSRKTIHLQFDGVNFNLKYHCSALNIELDISQHAIAPLVNSLISDIRNKGLGDEDLQKTGLNTFLNISDDVAPFYFTSNTVDDLIRSNETSDTLNAPFGNGGSIKLDLSNISQKEDSKLPVYEFYLDLKDGSEPQKLGFKMLGDALLAKTWSQMDGKKMSDDDLRVFYRKIDLLVHNITTNRPVMPGIPAMPAALKISRSNFTASDWF